MTDNHSQSPSPPSNAIKLRAFLRPLPYSLSVRGTLRGLNLKALAPLRQGGFTIRNYEK